MEKLVFDQDYWRKRYHQQQTDWDANTVTTPLKEYADQLAGKNIEILIPGCGNAHEGAYLHQLGFTQVYLADIAPEPLQDFSKKHPDFPKEHLLLINFFELSKKFDLILEQTFFCALDPSEREAYARQAAALLKPGGKLAGVLFNRSFEKAGPPFGGSKEDYQPIFEKYFHILVMEPCYNSIKPRSGTELFIKMEKKQTQ